MDEQLFSKTLKRSTILGWKGGVNSTPISINVFRNHSFEMVAGVVAPFAAFAGFAPTFHYSDYDDSLAFSSRTTADIEIIWLDLERYKNINVCEWLSERLMFLRSISDAPILLCCLPRAPELFQGKIISDLFFMDIIEITHNLKSETLDEAKKDYFGTRLTNKACLHLARAIGMQYIPALLKPALKALVIDLDNTLYEGIIGEDGINNVVLTPEHAHLQLTLKKLKNDGFFICVASKNEEKDVVDLFTKRRDFPLQFNDFSIIKANWKNKHENIQDIASNLNIGLDSILFIDDNPAEIQNILHAGLEVETLLAASPTYVANALRFYPGLLKLRKSNEDAVRDADVKANTSRQKLLKFLSPEGYFNALKIRLSYCTDEISQSARCAELLGKTNQFIFSLKRYNQTQIENFMKDGQYSVLSIAMSDSLSDSGIISVIVAHQESGTLYIDELAISCRALGRNIETFMLRTGFYFLAKKLNAGKMIRIPYIKSPRNLPALAWLNSVAGETKSESGTICFENTVEIKNPGIEILFETIES